MKRVLAVLLALGMVLSMSGCMSVQQSGSEESECAAILEQLLTVSTEMACDKSVCYTDKDYATYFEYWYDMPINFVSDGAICYVDAGDNADEISLLKPLSQVTYDTVKNALALRTERQIKHFTGLVDEQAARLENAALYESNGYLLWIMADDAQPVVEKFYELTEQG